MSNLPTHRRMFCAAVLAVARGTGAGALASAHSAGRMALASAVALSWSSSRGLAAADNLFGDETPCNNYSLDEEGVAFCEAYLAVGCDSNPENDQAVCDAMDAIWHNVTGSDAGPPDSSSRRGRELLRGGGGGGFGRDALDCCPAEVYGHTQGCQGLCVAFAVCELKGGSTHCLGSIVSLWLNRCKDLPLPGCGGSGCTCENGGTCNSDDSCSCPDGFIGTSCQVDQGALQTSMGADQLIEQPNSQNRYLAVYTDDAAGEISGNITETLSAVTWMVVAGGGAGWEGGGGAGGLLQTLDQTPSTVTLTGSISVQVGRGGIYSSNTGNQMVVDLFNGEDSFLRTTDNTINVTATGGGAGPGPNSVLTNSTINGGSGGGASNPFYYNGGTGISGQGNKGGDYNVTSLLCSNPGGGGGGAGAAGDGSFRDADDNIQPGPGGDGMDMSSSIGMSFGDNGNFAGGGGGWYRNDDGGNANGGPIFAVGGLGGGGNGDEAGTANTGGGGGGQGKSGGSGIVFIGFELP